MAMEGHISLQSAHYRAGAQCSQTTVDKTCSDKNFDRGWYFAGLPEEACV
jgi:hypothetical protein